MVRLAQPWSLRYPLVEGHGNFGSLAGDGAAAMRYTESRLSKIAEEGLLQNLKKKNVDWEPTYDDSDKEPSTLPALFPNLLCNPNMGIGVAMATSWQSHNLTEVAKVILAYLEDDSVDVSTMLPGPDFPGGGIVINGKDMPNVYKTGKGKAIVRGRYKEEIRKKKKLLVFYEIPYGVRTEALLEQVNEACEKGDVTGVEKVQDESDKKGLRIVFQCADPESVARQLFAKTDFQKNLSFNQVALINKVPKLLSLKDAIDVYINHNLSVIKREAEFDLIKVKERKHIVEGLLVALEDIDNVIQFIKKSPSAAAAKDKLINMYPIDKVQAKAILDMRLQKLAGLEKIELENENKELASEQINLEIIIEQKEVRKNILKENLSAFAKKFGDARRTEITNIEVKKIDKEVETVPEEECVVVLTKTGLIKRVPSKTFKPQRARGKGVKSESEAVLTSVSTNTIDNLMLFSNTGKMYKLLVNNIPSGTNVSKGTPVKTLIELGLGEKIIAANSLYKDTKAKYVVFFTEKGLIKKTALEEYDKLKRKKGAIAIKIKEGDSIALVTFLNEEEVIMVTKNGFVLRADSKDVKAQGRNTTGQKGIKIDSNDRLVAAVPIGKNTDSLALFTEDGSGKKISLSEITPQLKGGKGQCFYKDGKVAAAAMVSDEETLVLIGKPNCITISAKDIPLVSKTANGNILLKGSSIDSVVKL